MSRSFVYVDAASVAGYPGIGWYDNANPPNVCVIDLLGVQAPAGGQFYYETGRTYTNLPGFLSPTTTAAIGPVPAPCPAVVSPQCNALSGCAIRISPTTINPLARTLIPQDGVVCTQQSSFITCIATSGTWTLAACPWASSSFAARGAGVPYGTLGGTGFENVLLSQDTDCTAYDTGYDVSGLLGGDGNVLSSGSDGVPASLLVPFGNGADDTSYVVQCLSATYTTIDSSVVPPAIGSTTEDGVDYELILDLDGAGSGWTGPLAHHVGTGAGGNALQGLYDLGGDNDCDFNAAGSAPPQCSNGVDDSDADPLADVQDPQCFSSFNGVSYYNPAGSE